MNAIRIKKELFYIRKAFGIYKKGVPYVKHRFITAPKILRFKNVIEKPANFQDLSVHILTCHNDLIMLMWSLLSYYKTSQIFGTLYIHNDGSLTVKDKKILKNFFPQAVISDTDNFLETHSAVLEKYPIIKKFRSEYRRYVLLKKIIDPYFVSDKKIHLIIDSDLIWFSHPKEIEDEIVNGADFSLMMRTKKSCPVHFREQAFNDNLSKYNSGIVLYRKDNFDLEKFSEFLSLLDIDNPSNRHFIEQAGYSFSLKNLNALPEEKYKVFGNADERTVVRHYTSPRRALLYIEGIEKLKEIYAKNI